MRELFDFFKFFYRLRGKAFYILLFFVICSGFFEVIGVSLFFPILEGADSSSFLGRFFSSLFGFFHMQYSFEYVLVIMVLFLFLRSIFLIIAESFIGRTITRLMVDMRNNVVQGIFESDYQYFLKNDIGYINNAITVEFEKLAFAFRMFASVLSAIIFAVLYIVVPIMVVPFMTFAFIVVSFPILIVIKKINGLTKQYSVMSSQHSASLQKFLIQSLGNFKYLKATYSQGNILKKIYSSSEKLGDVLFKQSVFNAIVKNGFMPFVVIVIAVFLFYQVRVEAGETTEAGFVLLLLFGAAARLLLVQQNYHKFLASFGSISVFRNLEKGIEKNKESLARHVTAPDFSQPFIFKNVSFAYDDTKFVLRNINCIILPRTTVAFVGASGCGKSTLVTLLTGILRPSKGEIFLGEKKYLDIDQELLRKKIGYVTQESVIFNDDIRSNITLWHEEPSDDAICYAIEKAHIKKLVDSLPKKDATLLGDSGIKISGGQRQRISIARELFKDVAVLIFDEATSSLDSQAEKEIQRNIDELREERTVVLVTHRLSTVKNSDVIFVLKEGQIIEQGTYDELYKLGGEFKCMLDHQKVSL